MRNFAIIAELRSGYQMLATSLNSHPKAFCFGEIFGSDREVRKKSLWRQKVPVIEDSDDPVEYVKVLNEYGVSKGYEAIGFKLNYVCAKGPNWSHLWDHMAEDGWKFIHLTRSNLLNRLLSQIMAEQENNWSHKVYKSQATIEPSRLFFSTSQSFFWQKELREFLHHNEVFELVYEEVQANFEKKMSEVQGFLGLDVQQLTTPMKKQQTRSQSKAIKNYRELYRHTHEKRPDLIHFFEDALFL